MKRTAEIEEPAPKFPYTTKPGSLRKFLTLIPQRPKPAKINVTLLRSWGFKDGNDYSIVRVLKAVGMVGGDNTPTPDYVQFMHKETGPKHLAKKLRESYGPLFESSHSPHKESKDTLENLFNIHSGGSVGTKAFQIQTFKALCDHADFAGNGTTEGASSAGAAAGLPGNSDTTGAGLRGPTIHIDLHIHLPGNKSRRDYEYMFEDIARYIYGKQGSGAGSPEGHE